MNTAVHAGAEDDDAIHGLTDILDALDTLGRARSEVSVSDARERFGERSAGPFLLLPALLEVSPIGGIPGLPTVLALVITLFAVQLVMGRKHLWLPGWLERRHVSGDKLAKAASTLRRPAAFVDRFLKPRWRALTGRQMRRLIGLTCIALCATVPFLEIIPFASTVPMAAIILFGLAITVRDGLIAVLGLLTSLGAVATLVVALGN